MARAVVAGNWKMNTSVAEARGLAGELRESIGFMEDVERVLCPPFPYLALVREIMVGSSIAVGAQNMSEHEKGAFTGEVSPGMVAELCTHVILGHSERRALYGETDEAVNLKVDAALKAGLTPIICVGESLAQREAGAAEAVMERQLDQGDRRGRDAGGAHRRVRAGVGHRHGRSRDAGPGGRHHGRRHPTRPQRHLRR